MPNPSEMERQRRDKYSCLFCGTTEGPLWAYRGSVCEVCYEQFEKMDKRELIEILVDRELWNKREGPHEVARLQAQLREYHNLEKGLADRLANMILAAIEEREEKRKK